MPQTDTGHTSTVTEAYCPHCFLLVEQGVEDSWPPAPTRCPHCRLLIGAGRGRHSSAASPGARGAAAGVFANRARREDRHGASLAQVREAIRDVAEEKGERPERLLMVDYQQRALSDSDLPELSEIFAAFGSWKRARRAAAGH